MTQVLIFTGGGQMAQTLRPLGAYRIASELRDRGFTVKILDHTVQLMQLDPEYLQKALQKYVSEETLWIGVSSTFLNDLPAHARAVQARKRHDISEIPLSRNIFSKEILKELKSKYPKIKIVYGGGLAFAHFAGVDIFVEGYADTTAVELTKSLAGKLSSIQYEPGHYNTKRVVYDRKASTFDFQHSQTKWQEDDLIFHGEALPIEIARGCIFRCKFCSYPLNGKKKNDFIRDPGILREELERNYSLFGTRFYQMSDDTFNDSTAKLEMLYNEVVSKLSFKLQFAAYIRIDLVKAHQEQIDLLKALGLNGAFFGIESLNRKAAAAIGKGGDPMAHFELIRDLRTKWPDANLNAGFIVGLPHDTPAEIEHWGSIAAGKDSPLHKMFFTPLSLSQDKRKIWRSELELHPEKYGYTLGPGLDWWSNSETKMNVRDAIALSDKLFRLTFSNNKNHVGAFEALNWLGNGVTQEFMLSHTRSSSELRTKEGELTTKFRSRLAAYKDFQLK